jgi:hypothetical protein
MGRTKNTHYIPYDQAREIVQIEQLQSRSQYWTWWDMWQPVDLPRNPHRVFVDWISWNDFLGNNNKFKNTNPRQFRPFEEALAYAHTTNIATSSQWMETKHPDDVPVRPDIVYRHQFKGWKYFLKTGLRKATHAVEAAKSIENTQILVFLHQQWNPLNVFFVNVFSGIAAVNNFCKKNNMTIQRLFRYPSGYDWKSVVERHGSYYGNNEWIINDAQQLFFDIQMQSFR